MQSVPQLVEKYNDKIAKMDNVELIQASADDDVEEAVKWAKKESFPWPTVLKSDLKKTLLGEIRVGGVPTYVLLDKDGNELIRSDRSAPVMEKLAELNK